MSSPSILDLEEAQRRLRQFEQNHAEFLQLVDRVRQIHQRLEAGTRAAQERAERAEEQLSRVRGGARKLRGVMDRLASDGDDVVQRLEQTRRKLAESLDDLSATQRQLRSLLDRRTLLLAVAVCLAMLLGAFAAARRAPEPANRAAAHEPIPTADATDRRETRGASDDTRPDPAAPSLADRETPSQVAARVWTDCYGRTAEARFEGLRERTVFLRKTADGGIYPVPLNGLSAEDQRYLRESLPSWSP